MEKQKKRKELQQLETFRSLFPEFPVGREIITERPDFIIEDQTRRTGIEVTSIFHKPRRNGVPLQKQESERQQLVTEASKVYTASGHPKAHVSIHFAGDSKFHKHNRPVYARTIANLVASKIQIIDRHGYVENDYQSAETFPFEIHSLHIYRSEALDTTFFSIPVAGFVQEDFVSIIQEKLIEKDEALRKYQECTEYWLLILAEWSAPSSFFNPSQQTLSHEYTSTFDRVFFLNIFGRKLSQLIIVGGAG